MEISPALLASAAGLLPEDGPTAVEVDGTVAVLVVLLLSSWRLVSLLLRLAILLLHCKKWETDTYPDISGYFPMQLLYDATNVDLTL